MRNLLCSATAVSLLATGAAAQEARRPSTAPASTAVEELVVTATRREENLKDIPATISAVTAEQLAAAGPLNSTGDVLRSVPGIRFNDLQAPNLSEISVRGSGTQRATGADSGVGLFVNGAYVGSNTLGGRNFKTIDFFDLARVEVLEGPQGALYGRNSEYGVVNMVLARPVFSDTGYVDATYTGKLEQTKISGVVNMALSDEVAVRLSAQAIGQTGGFQYNPNADKYYDNTDGWLARGQVRFRRGPLDVVLLVDGQSLDLPTFLNTTFLAPGLNAQIPQGYFGNRFEEGHEGRDGVHQNLRRGMLLADYDLGWGKLTSTTMIVHWESEQFFAAGTDLKLQAQFQRSGQIGAYPFGQTHTTAKNDTLYQDLHLAGQAMDDRLEYLVGTDFLHQRDANGREQATTPCPLTLNASICAGTPQAPVCYTLIPTARPCPTPFPNRFGVATYATQENTAYAVYGSLKYHLGAVDLAGELRYSHDDKDAAQEQYNLYTTVLAAPSARYKFKGNPINYTVTASYKLPGEYGNLLYAKIGSGYRAGGVNARISSPFAPTPFTPTYDNENTTSYEAGFKGNLLGNVFLRLSAYASRTTNAITSISDGCSTLNACGQPATIFNTNGGTVHARGVEAAVDGRFEVAGGRLNVGLNAANQRAKYVSVLSANPGLPMVGSAVAQTPRWTYSASVNYRRPLADELDGFFNVSYQGQRGGVQDTVTLAEPLLPIAKLSNFGARAGLAYRRVEAAVFVTNLTDQTVQLLKFTTNG
ncbi:MAG: TonB-dependent receptor, partial [Phenylobacterium sp.]|nr:TonB-dependent receptor [Phenylobacterium sp.]